MSHVAKANRIGELLGLPPRPISSQASRIGLNRQGTYTDNVRLAYALGTSCQELFDGETVALRLRSALPGPYGCNELDSYWGHVMIGLKTGYWQSFPITHGDRDMLENQSDLEWAIFHTLNNRIVILHQVEGVEIKFIPAGEIAPDQRPALDPVASVVYEIATGIALYGDEMTELPREITDAMSRMDLEIDGDDILLSVGRTYLHRIDGQGFVRSGTDAVIEAMELGVPVLDNALYPEEDFDASEYWMAEIAAIDEIAFLSVPLLHWKRMGQKMYRRDA